MPSRFLAALLVLGIASSPAAARDAESREAFFDRLSALCGARYEGRSTFPQDGPFAGEPLVAELAGCEQDELRIPFAVGADRSRTWILSRGEDGLLLEHDHRHEDGTPDEITMYGGWAASGGSALAQSFSADEHTRKLIPEAATNVWTLSLSPDGDRLTYFLERHAAPRFRAVLERAAAPPARPQEARDGGAGAPIEIGLASGTEGEARAREQLERLLASHDLRPWLFTREVVIDEGDPIPHSHPVLTVNADYLDDDAAQLATLLHEQFHWFRGGRMLGLGAALADFRELFPEVPVGGGKGARDERSTYLHLVICDLELQALTQLVGETEARRVLSAWTHYTWIYRQVLTNPAVRETNRRHGLVVPAPGDRDAAG